MIPSNPIKIARPLENDSLSEILIEILIPFKDNYKSVSDILLNLQNIKNINFVVTLIDDNSDNISFGENLKKLPGINFIRLNENRGFGFCINEAVKLSKNSIFVVMHSDVFNIETNSIKNLVKGLIEGKAENVAVVSGVFDNPLPKECGFLKFENPANLDLQIITNSNDFVPFIFAAFSKNAFAKAGGFPNYNYVLYEDKLLCKKLMAFGYKIAYCPKAFCRHKGGETIKKLISKDKKILELIKNNKIAFQQDSKMLDEFLEKNRNEST